MSQEIIDAQVNPAVWEISGHFLLKRKEDFEAASEAYVCRLLSDVSLSEERFQEVKAYIIILKMKKLQNHPKLVCSKTAT